MKRLLSALLISTAVYTQAQTLEKLTVEKIMRDPKWMGTAPDTIRWSEDSKKIYFKWNPENLDRVATYSVGINNTDLHKLTADELKDLPAAQGSFNKSRSVKIYEKNGDIFLLDIAANKVRQLTNTTEIEGNLRFSDDGTDVLFVRNNNLYSLNITSASINQLTNFIPSKTAVRPLNAQDKWLKDEQLALFDVLKEQDKNQKTGEAERKVTSPKRPKEVPLDGKQVNGIQVSPGGRFISYRLIKQPEGARLAVVPSYVTATGYTEDIPNRTKVGAPLADFESFIYDTSLDTTYAISTKDIPGIKDLPDFVKDYPKQLEERRKANADRKVTVGNPLWSEDGRNAVVIVSAQDNKDRWIMKLDAGTGKLSLLDRQRDEAWIGGPGIVAGGNGNIGWLNNTDFYYQSELSGYSHLYLVNVLTGTKRQLTSGNWEVQNLRLSNDKKTFYFTANIEHPGITHYYRIPASGGAPVKLTAMKGGNEVTLSPDEKWLAIRHSSSDKPWELYIQPNKAGSKATQVTNSVTPEFKSYPWREPEMISFKNRYGATIYARLYQPKTPHAAKPAVVFVHGAGYLQNVHFWWSQYFREYMFNNLLADNGYTVLDIDYTGSAGYGRDHRTGIYRHMGGKDLTDQVDGVKLLVEKYGVNPAHVGLYGGSYGGFITLMALFTQADTFTSGAALRSVTDWAHYNHGYTSNILNEPYTDEKAYQQSSPLNFASGLKGNLLMLHGMVDQNVNFQDIVRLSQRLIELGKDNWELAVYPVEDHAFVQPSSWTDEYKRVLKLFEETLKK